MAFSTKNDLPIAAVSARLAEMIEDFAEARRTGQIIWTLHFKDGHLKLADFSVTSRMSRAQEQGSPPCGLVDGDGDNAL